MLAREEQVLRVDEVLGRRLSKARRCGSGRHAIATLDARIARRQRIERRLHRQVGQIRQVRQRLRERTRSRVHHVWERSPAG
jgi:hypothetical protein